MANTTYTVSDPKKSVHAGGFGNRSVYVDGSAVPATILATTDKIQVVRVPAGTKIDRVVISNPDLDTGTNALQAKIGFENVDGSAAPTGSDTAVAAAGANGLTAASTTPAVYDIFPPYLTLKDMYLVIVPTVAGNAAPTAGTVYGKVEGESIGVR